MSILDEIEKSMEEFRKRAEEARKHPGTIKEFEHIADTLRSEADYIYSKAVIEGKIISPTTIELAAEDALKLLILLDKITNKNEANRRIKSIKENIKDWARKRNIEIEI